MIFKNGGTGQDDLNGFLDAGSHFHGELTFEASFRVDGKLTGKVRSGGSLVVGEGGEVDGEIKAGQIFVSGTLRGAVEATERLQIAPGGRVLAEIVTPSLVIEDGAIFEGKCTMTGDGGVAVPRAAEQPRLIEAAGAEGRATS